MKGTIFALASVAALAACGGPQGGGKDEGGEATTATAAASGWDATNACARLDKAALGAALGDTVTETNLGLVHQATAVEAAIASISTTPNDSPESDGAQNTSAALIRATFSRSEMRPSHSMRTSPA